MSKVRDVLLVFLGCLLGVGIILGTWGYWMWSQPVGAVTNQDYPLVQISNLHGESRYELRKGESKLVPYGEYESRDSRDQNVVHPLQEQSRDL